MAFKKLNIRPQKREKGAKKAPFSNNLMLRIYSYLRDSTGFDRAALID